MTLARSRRLRIAAGLVLLGLTLFVWPLTLDVPLTDPDEGLHAAIAQEMVERGDWVVPRMLGEPFLDKPVLYFWAQAAALDVFGMREAAVRLPGLVFGLLGALTTAWLAAEVAGRRAAVTAGALYATTLLPLAIAQAGVHDVALVPWTNLALVGLWRAAATTGAAGRMRWILAAGVFVGLAMLTKGLVGVALIGLPFAVWLMAERRLTPGLVVAGGLTLVVGAVIASPWYAAMEAADPGYLRYYFFERHVMGFATSTQVHGQRPWWYYLPIVAGGSLPWVLGLPFASPRRLGPRWTAGTRLLWIWLLVDVAVLSVARSKMVTYILPALPAAAILAAVAWDRWREEAGRRGANQGRWLLVAHGLIVVALVPVAAIVADVRFDVRPDAAIGAGAALVLVAAILALSRGTGGVGPRALGWLLTAMALAFVTVMASLFAPVARDQSARDLSRALNRLGELPSKVWVVDERIGSVVFYLEPRLRRELGPDRFESVGYGTALRRLATAPADILVAVAARDADRLVRGAAGAAVPYEVAGRYRLYRVGDLRTHLLDGKAVIGYQWNSVTGPKPEARSLKPE